MGKDVEEGEISETASVEEISEEDFNIKQEEIVKVVKETKPIRVGGGEGAGARVWTMRDLYNKYPTICRGYGPGLHNLAWAQAVQNKPLKEVLGREVEQDDVSKPSSPASSVASVNSSGAAAGKDDKKEVDRVVIDDSGDEMEKEEGELEEGEIEMDLESGSNDKVSEQVKLIDVDSIREALESVVNVVDGDILFQGVCSKLEIILESLLEVVNRNNVPKKDSLVQLAFSAVQSVHSVFCSMNNVLKQQNEEILTRLLTLIKSHDPPIFTSDQMKEVEVMIYFMGARASDKEKDMQSFNGVNGKDSNALAENIANDLKIKNNVPSAVDSFMQNKPLELTKPVVFGYKSRGVLLPLLDPHKVHDVDSLPSPTRETTPCMPVHRALVVGDIVKPGSPAVKVAHDTEVHIIPRYETEALKAVSSYQQKFGRNSFFMNNELPSPTPSEESGDGSGDTGVEISSASTVDKPKPVNPPTLGQQTVSSQPMDISSLQGLTTANSHAPVSSGSNPVVKPNPVVKASVKSRDPRLRFASSNALDINHQPVPMVHNAPKVELVGGGMNSRKQKTVEEPVFNGPVLKRQRNGFENSGFVRDEKNISGSGGCLEDTDMAEPHIMNRSQLVETAESNPRKLDIEATRPITTSGTPNVVVCGNEPVPVTIPCTTAFLPSLLKDIVVNPTILLNILKMGQRKLPAEAPQRSDDTSISTMPPPISSSIPSVNTTSSTPSAIFPKPMGALQVPSQSASMDELGKVRMKPRDPRRILHGNALQRSGNLGPELKTDGPSTPSTQGSKEILNSQMQQGPAEAKPVLSQSSLQPDFTRQFTKNLKDIADFISVSQPLASEPMVSQNLLLQPGQIKLGASVKAVVFNHDDKQTGTCSAPEIGPVGSHPQNTWGDVEHFFEGYDDQQKAAIQRERARRMEEQKKMFSARKLCLVLDLDHTLLNSAKFHEVDAVHDEILRKKEEQDREKPQRHLFRFPHMGMWTKLRPGIWTFLERASNLFELHLYTMGNKLYATEMAKVLDPSGVLFAGRVISRGDDGDPFDGDERVPKSKDLEGVLGMESDVVIIDDSVRVWPHNKLNLIVVERYTYFPSSRRQFGLPGPSLLEIDRDERPEDGTLASSLGVIERVHKIFFSHQSLDDVDVRNILAAEQRKILAGCRIVFSRVFPVGEANPHLHPLWQTAEQFGAVCTKQIDDQVTHVVAISLGTDKVNWALSTGRFVVHPGWVEASALLYRRANEQNFMIKPTITSN